MKFSIILLVFFSAGIVMGIRGFIPIKLVTLYPFEDYLLYILLFLVGVSLGSDSKAIQGLFKVNFITILIPIMVAIYVSSKRVLRVVG